MRKTSYRHHKTDSCTRFCRNVCGLFLFGQRQCFRDCIRCTKKANGPVDGIRIQSRKKCNCGR